MECLDYLQPGNVLMVADLTRLDRSTADLAYIVTVLGWRGIGFRSLAEPWLDTTSAHGKLIFDSWAFRRSAARTWEVSRDSHMHKCLAKNCQR